MSADIPAPREAFFVSEEIADQLDMSQFGPSDAIESDEITSAVLRAEIVFESGESMDLNVTSCSLADAQSFGIVTSVESPTQLSMLIGQAISSVALIVTDTLIFDVQVNEMKKTIEVQATGGQYYLVALNFEKKNLLIKG